MTQRWPSATYHVVRNPRSGWDVRRDTAKRASSNHRTQSEAAKAARGYLQKAGGGELIIHGADGRIRERNSFGGGLQQPTPEPLYHPQANALRSGAIVTEAIRESLRRVTEAAQLPPNLLANVEQTSEAARSFLKARDAIMHAASPTHMTDLATVSELSSELVRALEPVRTYGATTRHLENLQESLTKATDTQRRFLEALLEMNEAVVEVTASQDVLKRIEPSLRSQDNLIRSLNALQDDAATAGLRRTIRNLLHALGPSPDLVRQLELVSRSIGNSPELKEALIDAAEVEYAAEEATDRRSARQTD
jgi:hypothetical protein